MGIFDGVEIHKKQNPQEYNQEEREYFLAKETLGTDFALSFGRTLFLHETARYTGNDRKNCRLSERAEPGSMPAGEADYNWSGYHDNCSHTLHNALAAAGVWPF